MEFGHIGARPGAAAVVLVDDRSVGGRWFYVAGPLTAKLRCPVAVRARGTSIVPVAADRRC